MPKRRKSVVCESSGGSQRIRPRAYPKATHLFLWDVLELKEIAALTITYCCDHCQSAPLSDCTWYLCIGVSKSVSKEGSIWFCGRCWHINVWRRGSRILSLRHGLEPSGVALYRAFSTTTGEVETFCTTMRLTMNFIDGNKLL